MVEILNRRQSIVSVRSFLEEERALDTVIKICHLYPDPNDWKIWYDDCENKVEFRKNKKPKITRSFLDYKTKDIYFKSKPWHIAKISSWFLLLVGKNKLDQEITIIYFLGRDYRLRACIFSNGEWLGNISPIFTDFNVLKLIAKNINNKKISRVRINKCLYKGKRLTKLKCFYGKCNAENSEMFNILRKYSIYSEEIIGELRNND